MTYTVAPLSGRYWRMLNVHWQKMPLQSGSHIVGGRWNPVGTPALYLSAEHATAVSEFHQDLVRPGTLVPFDVTARAIVDLTVADRAITHCLWRDIYRRRGTPPSWPVAQALIAAGAEGALVPSVQHPGGVNLVLWRWYDAAAEDRESGAAVRLLDPDAVLTGDSREPRSG